MPYRPMSAKRFKLALAKLMRTQKSEVSSRTTRRPMSAAQYKAALADLKLSQARAGWIFGGKSRGSGRLWPAEGASYQVALIISLMRLYHITPEEIEAIGALWQRKDETE